MAGLVSVRRDVLGILALAPWCFAAGSGAVQAQDLPPLRGDVMLTVTGLDPAVHPGGEVKFDLPMLEALGQEDVVTSSIWTTGTHAYTGLPLRKLADYLKLGNAAIKLHALNDYAVDIPLAEVEDKAPILAYEMDGQPMPVRDKGPIWLIYPYDAGTQYRTDLVFARSVWQLDRIEVLR